MTQSLQRPLLALLSLLLVLVSAASLRAEAASPPAQNHTSPPLLSGTYIQLLEENGKWSSARWERLFDHFQALGLTRVVVQWSLLDSSAFHAPPDSAQPPAPVQTILQAAESRGIEVYLGLAAESGYWEMIKQPAAGQEGYLRQLRLKSERVAREVAPVAQRYRAFRGWYIPEEVDDLSWRAPQSRKVLYRHLSKLSSFLKALTPGKELLLSAFSNARMSPDSYREFWNDLLGESQVDVVLFQDGAGVGKLPEELLPVYLQAVGAAADANHRKLQVVVELFEMVSESPFKARPAPFPRVRRQLETAEEFSSGGSIAFSVPDYMSYDGGAAARELLEGYLRYKQ